MGPPTIEVPVWDNESMGADEHPTPDDVAILASETPWDFEIQKPIRSLD
jgi:hypothetical protein